MIEINPNHSIITRLNTLRKQDQKLASVIVWALVDNIFLSTGIPIDTHKSTDRNYKILDDLMESKLTPKGGQPQVEIEDMPADDRDDSTMKKADQKRPQKPQTITIDEFKTK